MEMKLKLLVVAFTGLSFTACNMPQNSLTPSTSQPLKKTYKKPTAAKLAAYQETMSKVASSIKDDPNYNKITLDTPEKKAWFRDLTYRLWDRQISKDQFISEGLKKYPTHRYEFEFVVKGFSS